MSSGGLEHRIGITANNGGGELRHITLREKVKFWGKVTCKIISCSAIWFVGTLGAYEIGKDMSFPANYASMAVLELGVVLPAAYYIAKGMYE